MNRNKTDSGHLFSSGGTGKAYAIRTALIYYEMYRFIRLEKEGARVLNRISTELKDDDLQAAYLFEQIAYCYLENSNNPLMRKYAFNMVMAGTKFLRSGPVKQRPHSRITMNLLFVVIQQHSRFIKIKAGH